MVYWRKDEKGNDGWWLELIEKRSRNCRFPMTQAKILLWRLHTDLAGRTTVSTVCAGPFKGHPEVFQITMDVGKPSPLSFNVFKTFVDSQKTARCTDLQSFARVVEPWCLGCWTEQEPANIWWSKLWVFEWFIFKKCMYVFINSKLQNLAKLHVFWALPWELVKHLGAPFWPAEIVAYAGSGKSVLTKEVFAALAQNQAVWRDFVVSPWLWWWLLLLVVVVVLMT